MFHVNDVVCYGAQGVCRITQVEKLSFGDGEKLYYTLTPMSAGGATVYVPVDNERLTARMRRTLSPEEIGVLVREVSEEAPVWESDENLRKARYHELLTGGDRRALVREVRALYHHRQSQLENHRRLHVCDERFLKDAERLLYDEFARVLNIQPEQVLPFILEQLTEEERCKICRTNQKEVTA